MLFKEHFIIQSQTLSKPYLKHPKKRLLPSVVAVSLDPSAPPPQSAPPPHPTCPVLLDSHFYMLCCYVDVSIYLCACSLPPFQKKKHFPALISFDGIQMGWSGPKLTTYWPSCISNVTCSAHARRVAVASLRQDAESFCWSPASSANTSPWWPGSLIVYAPPERRSCLPRCQNNQVELTWQVMKEY